MLNAYTGVTFGDKHSYYDWGLYMTERFSPQLPSPQTQYIKIPGADGVLDYSEVLTGEIQYEMRSFPLKFKFFGKKERWDSLISDIADYLHGKRMKLISDTDPGYYYEGRFTLDRNKTNKQEQYIIVNCYVNPYKMEITSSVEDWLWDAFNFEDGIIRDYRDIRVDGEYRLMIYGRRKTVVPLFDVVSDNGTGIQVQLGSETYFVPDGTNVNNIRIRITEGENELIISGNANISINYRGGRL